MTFRGGDVALDPIFGCRIWLGRLDADGYGRDGSRQAHLVAWERAHGPLPEAMALDHMCRRRHCIALHHLELVTKSENERRKSWRRRAARTHCPQGHDLTQHGVVTPDGGIVCRVCNQEAASATPGVSTR